MKTSMKQDRQLIREWILDMERWIALLIDIACVVVSLWAILDGHQTFPLSRISHLSRNLLVSFGWLLTITVGYLGLMLIQFSFHASSEPETRKTGPPIAPSRTLPDDTHGLTLLSAKRGRS